jgi:uncharacterized protein (DUF1800 family)
MSLEGAIAAHRFGLGARPGEIARASADPKGWLLGQMNGPAPQPVSPDGEPFENAGALVASEDDYKVRKFMRKGEKKKGLKGVKSAEKPAMKDGPGNLRRKTYMREIGARFALGFTTDRPFAERMVRFWSNHFTISTQRHKIMMFAGDFEREAIRPHINGTFEDMLFAVCMHPAMQIYLDNWHSIGPHSLAGSKRQKGLNENLGRELMELYTLGVDGGYSQADVVAMAKLLTGWGVYDGRPSGFGFYAQRHEPGPITLRGKTYPAGWDGGVAAIRDLARDPATARNIARKMAAHFISDRPPKDSVARLQKSFVESGGKLHALYETIVGDPAAWDPRLRKMRAPVEYVTAAMRAVGWPRGKDPHRQEKHARRLIASVRLMGEVPFAAPSPKGWPDDSEAWSGSDGLLDRIEWAKTVGEEMGSGISAAAVAEAGLGPLLGPVTKSVMAEASSQGEALALLLASPEFQRR